MKLEIIVTENEVIKKLTRDEYIFTEKWTIDKETGMKLTETDSIEKQMRDENLNSVFDDEVIEKLNKIDVNEIWDTFIFEAD